jgi:hypothetical protein
MMSATEIETTSSASAIDRAFAELVRGSFLELTEGFVVCRSCGYLSSGVIDADGKLVDLDAPHYFENGAVFHKCGSAMSFLKDRGHD